MIKQGVRKIETLDENGDDIEIYLESAGSFQGKLSVVHLGHYYSARFDYSGVANIETFILDLHNRSLADYLSMSLPYDRDNKIDIKETLKAIVSKAIDEIYDKQVSRYKVGMFWESIKKYPLPTDPKNMIDDWINDCNRGDIDIGNGLAINLGNGDVSDCIKYKHRHPVYTLETLIIPAIKEELIELKKVRQAVRDKEKLEWLDSKKRGSQ